MPSTAEFSIFLSVECHSLAEHHCPALLVIQLPNQQAGVDIYLANREGGKWSASSCSCLLASTEGGDGGHVFLWGKNRGEIVIEDLFPSPTAVHMFTLVFEGFYYFPSYFVP